MTRRELLCELGYEDSVVFENPGYDSAIVGITDDGNVVYSREKMVDCLCEEYNMSRFDAEDFIDFNTIRSIPYADEPKPIVMREIDLWM